MATTYTWTISQMDAHIEYEGENNVIYTVHWRYNATSDEKDPTTGVNYAAESIGAQTFEWKKGEPFVPYENTEAFEDVVIGWLEDVLDVSAMQQSLDKNIDSQIHPVNEELYFTWQKPTPPPVEEEEEEVSEE